MSSKYLQSIDSKASDIASSLRGLVDALQDAIRDYDNVVEDLRLEESRNEDLEQQVEYYREFIDNNRDLYTAWIVAKRMEA